MRLSSLYRKFLQPDCCLLPACTQVIADESLDKARKNGITYGFSNEPPYAYLGPDGKGRL
jgi:hypothetical protein